MTTCAPKACKYGMCGSFSSEQGPCGGCCGCIGGCMVESESQQASDSAKTSMLLLMAEAWEAGWQAGAGWPQQETNPYRAVASAFDAGEYTDKAGQRWIKSDDGWVFDDNAGGVWVTTPEVLAAKISEEANAV